MIKISFFLFSIMVIISAKLFFFDNTSKFKDVPLVSKSNFDLGKEIFLNKGNCASCHALSNAGSVSESGPNLDKLAPNKIRIIKAMTEGVGVMQSSLLEGILNKDEIELVAEYVYQATNN